MQVNATFSTTGRGALFAVKSPEERDSFKPLCEVVRQRNVTEFNYRTVDEKLANVFVGFAVGDREEAAAVGRALTGHEFETRTLAVDDLAKDHIRHMVGGPSRLVHGERIYSFQFPEHPGA